MGMEQRGCIDQPYLMANQQWEEPSHHYLIEEDRW
jgi:hypothetical protein